MRILLVVLLLAACSLPGRQTFAPNPVAADTASISATQAFSDRIALVTILPNTTDYAAPLANAVHQALAIKPGAKFDVEAQSPQTGSPDANAANLKSLAPLATAIAQAIAADGVAPQNIALTAKTAGVDADILVYVK